MLESAVDLIFTHIYGISDEYGVNPLIFGLLYFATVPLFWVSLFYLGKNIKQKQTLILPIIGVLTSQLLCYIYLFSSATNLPSWVYIVVLGIILYSVYRVRNIVRSKIRMEMEQSF